MIDLLLLPDTDFIVRTRFVLFSLDFLPAKHGIGWYSNAFALCLGNPNLLNQKVIFVLPLINKYKPIYIDFGYFFRYKWLS
jgi:hypothetical protein